ncbi:hypothetical protein Tco_0651956 [Tanacetum coccineum]|uniref:Uncharacterized protein n=1 Tax=Tanacetum coccineum TaxID=301880 RepID=A0ABQ4WWA4_9ASTR
MNCQSGGINYLDIGVFCGICSAFGKYEDDMIQDVAHKQRKGFVLYDLTKPQVPASSIQLDRVEDLVLDEHDDEASSSWSSIDEENLDLGERMSSSMKNLKGKHHFKLAPSFSHIPIDHHHLIASHVVVQNMIKSFPRDTSCGRDELRAKHLMDYLSGVVVAMSVDIVGSITQVVNLFFMRNAKKKLGEYIASAPLSLLVNPGGGMFMGIDWRHLVSKVSVDMIDHFF